LAKTPAVGLKFMKPAVDGGSAAGSTLKPTCLDGIFMLRVRAAGEALDRNAFSIHGEERLLVDPIASGNDDLVVLRAEGVPDWIVVTNAETSAQSHGIARDLGARVASGAPTGAGALVPDRELRDGERIGRAQVYSIKGGAAGQIPLHIADARAIVTGNILIGEPAGCVRMLSDDRFTSPTEAALSVRRLWALQPQHVLVGRGDCVFGNATALLGTCLQSRSDVYVNRINLDELEWQQPHEPSRYEAFMAEVGQSIGARSLGYRLVRLPPGKTFCPLHWHEEDEELFFILDGKATLHTPRGDFEVRRGDFIAFPTGPIGAHAIRNDGDQECTVMMLSDNSDGDDICHYPDSNKVLLSESGLILRKEPDLDYYDGEHT